MIGRSMCAAISRTIASLNAPPCVEVPTRIVGWTLATTSARPIEPPSACASWPARTAAGVGCWKSRRSVHVVDQQTLPVHELEPPRRLLLAQAVLDHHRADLVGDPDAGGPAPKITTRWSVGRGRRPGSRRASRRG